MQMRVFLRPVPLKSRSGWPGNQPLQTCGLYRRASLRRVLPDLSCKEGLHRDEHGEPIHMNSHAFRFLVSQFLLCHDRPP